MCCFSFPKFIPCERDLRYSKILDRTALEKCVRDLHILESSSKFENLHCFLKNLLSFLLAVLGIFSGPVKTLVVIVVFEFETIG